jgi:hypothetical protein
MPCQWMLVGTGNSLMTLMATRSPLAAVASGPGRSRLPPGLGRLAGQRLARAAAGRTPCTHRRRSAVPAASGMLSGLAKLSSARIGLLCLGPKPGCHTGQPNDHEQGKYTGPQQYPADQSSNGTKAHARSHDELPQCDPQMTGGASCGRRPVIRYALAGAADLSLSIAVLTRGRTQS